MRVADDDIARSAAFRASRLAKLDALHITTHLLIQRFDQHTQARWDAVKKVADAGFLQHSRAMAASVQVLQDRVDANNKALAKHKAPLDGPSTAQHTSSSTPQLQDQSASCTSAQPEQHLHHQEHAQAGSSSSSLASASSRGSNPQGSCSRQSAPRPAPPPPPLPGQPSALQPVRTKPAGRALPGKAVFARQAGAQQGHMPRPAPPPPPGPPPPHKWRAGATAGPGMDESGGKHAAAAATQSGPAGSSSRPAPPPPPGPPLPHPFSAHTYAATKQQQQDGVGSRPAPPPPSPPLPPGGFGAACRPQQSKGTAQGLNPSSPAAARQAGSSGPAPAPPPPPPPPPLGGFKTPPRPKTAPGGCSSGSAGPHPGINALAAAAAAAGARRTQQDGQEPSTPKGALLSHSSFSSMVSPRSAEVGASTCSKLKRLHVDAVPKNRMMAGSFWNTTGKLAETFQAEFEFALRSMFSSTTASERRATDGGGGGGDGAAADEAAGRVIKVIPDKRALQVEVCIKRLRMDAPALAAALNRIDTDRLKQDDLPQIRSMLPKPDELSAVTAAKKRAMKDHKALKDKLAAEKLAAMAAAAGSSGRVPDSGSSNSDSAGDGTPPAPRLGVVEAAFEALGGVQMLMAKMRACEFKYDIEAVSAQVDDFVADLSASLSAFRSCGQLQYLLAFVRDVANTMNASAVQGGTAVEGLKLDSLSRLQSTRMAGATDLNLLHYIVAHLSSVMPGALELDATREVFKAVTKRGTFDTVLTRVRGLRDMHKRITNDLAKAREHVRRTSPKQAGSGSCGKGSSRGGSVSSPPAAGPDGTSSGGGSPAASPSPPAAAAAAASETAEGGDGGSGSLATPAAAAAAAAGSDAAGAAAAAEQRVYIDRLAQLLESSGGKLDSMDAKMQGVIQQFRWTAEFFCEDVNVGWKQQPAAFITHFADLLEALEATKKDTARVAKVNKILGQFFEERQRQEEEADAAAAAAAAAAAEAGVELAWPEDADQQLLLPSRHQRLLLDSADADAYSDSGPYDGEQQQGGSVDGDGDEEEVLRLTRTNSWVLGVANLARSLQFGPPSGSDEEGSEAGSSLGLGHAGVDAGVRGLPNGPSASGEGLLLLQQQQEHSGDHPWGADSTDYASQSQQQQQQGATIAASAAGPEQQQQQGLSLPVTRWQPDMLVGVWGSCLSVASGGAPDPGSSCASSRRSSTEASRAPQQ